VHPHNYVAGVVVNDHIGMGGTVIEEVLEGLHGGLGAVGLLGGQGAEGHKHGWVHSTGIVEEDTNDFLDMFVGSSIEGRGLVRVRGVLDFCTISGALPGMGGMFGAGGVGMMKVEEGTGNITRHGDVNVMVLIVSFEHQTTIPGGGPILSHLVMGMQGIHKVGGIGPVGVAHHKVVNH